MFFGIGITCQLFTRFVVYLSLQSFTASLTRQTVLSFNKNYNVSLNLSLWTTHTSFLVYCGNTRKRVSQLLGILCSVWTSFGFHSLLHLSTWFVEQHCWKLSLSSYNLVDGWKILSSRNISIFLHAES